MHRPKVILRRCDSYDVDRIADIIRTSIEELNLDIRGKVFVKPNIVTANRRYIHHSFTHPAVVEAMVRVLGGKPVDDICIGESGGFGIPSRLFFRESGFAQMARRIDVRLVDLNEHPMDTVNLKKGVWHKQMLLSRFIGNADFKVWMPKLKYHIVTSITQALKLNIGILSHKERMLFHDYRLHDKIVDMLEPGFPGLVVSDAIDITYGFESAPYPVRLGLLLIADPPLAADAVAATIMGYDPHGIRHLQIAANRGYGSLDLGDYDIDGDVTIDELRQAPKGQTRLFQFLNELDTPMQFYAGTAPGTDTICDGGCECAIKGCLGTIEKRTPGALKSARKGALVTGIYKGDVIMPDGPVLLIGDCTRVEGQLTAAKVHRIKGCPMGARDLFLKIPRFFGMPNPMLDRRDAGLFLYHTAAKGLSILKNRLLPDRRAW